MSLPRLLEAFRDVSAYRGLTRELPPRGRELVIGGLTGSSPAVLVSALTEDFPQRVFVVVTATPQVAERWLADLAVLTGDAARLYPQREALGEEEPHLEIHGERVETLEAMLRGTTRVIVTTLRATSERTRMPAAVAAHRLDLSASQPAAFAEVVHRLEAMGYAREPTVLDVGQFAVRGGIVDVYGFGMAAPTRMEWWGDEIISIRHFDLDSQRSEGEVESITVLPVTPAAMGEREGGRTAEAAGAAERQSLLDLVPPDALLVVDEGVDEAEIERVWDEAAHHIELAQRRGEDVPGQEAVFLSPDEWWARWSTFGRVVIDDGRTGERENGSIQPAVLRSSGPPVSLSFNLGPPPAIERDMGVIRRISDTTPVLILCDNEGQLERLEELLFDDPAAPRQGTIQLALGALGGGFLLPGLAVLTDHEIFRRARRLRRPRRYRQAITAGPSPFSSGSFVVHLEHGIGIYRGLATITVGEATTMDVAVLEYEGGDRLNVPLYRLDQLETYRTASDGDGTPPRLDRLGGTRWHRRREKAEAAIRRMAAELVELYARRRLAEGYAFPPDTRWQRELESAFLYEDTPDQRRAADETKQDMERPRPMDRLIVGDVGYGKTEIAVRAAFKAVQAGKQVAVLVPTTILAEQHGRTFRDRLAEYPVKVEVMSRFRTTAEQADVLRKLAAGTVDIVIGTHRLLSSDVTFGNLGLLIVDEEHRFGVRHKERLKALRLQVDILTLTATPIPRTLNMALAGLRDLTLIETPPRDRSPVLTFVEPWDDELLEEVLARELDRGGQVFFVHNRIETIATVAERVRRLAPRARVAVAHGQMKERELDAVMRDFVDGAVGILVSTMIVESGLDVTNANTMIVHDAHQFGLAQLYQLRGRVGRGHRRAYCYLLVPDIVDPDGERRLQVLEHHTELGTGYRIALRDLEIRGAGNLLGAEQSGHAHAVGFDLYMRWLNDTVRALKGERIVTDRPPPEVTVDAPAYLPDRYVPDEDAKIDIYRRLARAAALGEIAGLRDELRDRFGPLPPEAERLLLVSELRTVGTSLGLDSVTIRGDDARLKFRSDAAPKLMRLTAALDDVQFAADVRQTVPLALRLRRLGGMPTGPGLVRALTVAGDERTNS
jgi:transcription-repair coupling factor (superfamily II helicase)